MSVYGYEQRASDSDFFLFLLFLLPVGIGYSGTGHPIGYKVESPSFVHCFGVHFFLSATHLSTFSVSHSASLKRFSTLDECPSRETPYRVLITSLEPRSYHMDRIQIIHHPMFTD